MSKEISNERKYKEKKIRACRRQAAAYGFQVKEKDK
jgi:hypothetical protein